MLTTAVATATGLGASLDVADPLLTKFMTGYVLERAKQLDATTHLDVATLIRSKFESGVAPAELNAVILDAVREKFDGYEAWRANRIGRSESAIAYNHANIMGFSQAGVSEVEVVDGTDDEICDAANGSTYTLRESLSDPIGHPNCTRSFVPIIPTEDQGWLHYEMLMLDNDLPGFCAAVSEYIASLEDPCTDRVLEPLEEESVTLEEGL